MLAVARVVMREVERTVGVRFSVLLLLFRSSSVRAIFKGGEVGIVGDIVPCFREGM